MRRAAESRRRWIQAGILALALLAIGLGVLRGEVRTVLNKSIRVCLECIGLG